MHFGYLGAATSYGNEKAARDALAAAEKVVNKLDVEVRVLKSRKAPPSKLAPVVARLTAAVKERDRLKAVVKAYDAREKRAEKLAKEADAKADAAYKLLESALKKELLTKKSQLKEVNNAIALNRVERDRARTLLFDADKAEAGLEAALRRRIARYQKHLAVYEKRVRAYATLPISKDTKAAVVGFARETIEFMTGNIKLDMNEINAIRGAKVSGNKAVVTSPAKLKAAQAGLLRHTKLQLSLVPGAALPTHAEIQMITMALMASIPQRPGENAVAYAMRIRRYAYRAAIRLANLKHKSGKVTVQASTADVKSVVVDTQQKDAAAIEEEHKGAVFAPAGEQQAVSVVDAATNATAAVVPPATPTAVVQGSQSVTQFESSTAAQQNAASMAQVAEAAITPSGTSVAAFLPTADASASTSLPTVASSPESAAAQIDVAATIEQAKSEVAAEGSSVEAAAEAAGSEADSGTPKPFYKKPVGIGIIGLGVLAAVKAFSR
jgi:hypothetical protein